MENNELWTSLKEKYETLQVNGLAYDLIKEILLKDILGKEDTSILYWAGRHLARKIPLQHTSEIITFFDEMGLGMLKIVKEKKNSALFELSSPLIHARLESFDDVNFQLEAGFLAEQLQQINHCFTEASEEKRKGDHIYILVQWDVKDKIIEEE